MNLPELLKIAEAATPGESDCQQAFAKLRMMDFYSAFNPSVAIGLIKRLQEAEKELSALSDLLYTVERASDKGNLPHWMQDDYDSYVAAMNGGKE